MKNPLLIILAFTAISCNQNFSDKEIEQEAQSNYKPNSESIELNNKALEISKFQRYDTLKVDSALLLLDKATELDSLYFLGYANKVQFLMFKQDFQRLLENNKKIRELRPNQPNWIIQHGLILELSDEIDKANKEYKIGINEYEKIMNSDANLSWEFELEFAQSLVIANNYEEAQKIINRLKKENPDLEIWEFFELKTKDKIIELIKKRP